MSEWVQQLSIEQLRLLERQLQLARIFLLPSESEANKAHERLKQTQAQLDLLRSNIDFTQTRAKRGTAHETVPGTGIRKLHSRLIGTTLATG